MIVPTPEALTFEDVKTWDAQTMKDQMRHPEMKEAILRVITTKNQAQIEEAQAQIEANSAPSEVVVPATEVAAEQVAAEEAQRAAAAEQEAAKRAAEDAETLRATGVTIYRDQTGDIYKLVQDYQATDEHGSNIGRPTHLESRSWPELVAKQKEAHIQATRAFHRLKSQKVSFKDQQPVQPSQLSDSDLLAAMKDLKSDDPQKQLEAIRMVQKAESDKLRAEQDELVRQQQVSRAFLANHRDDFNNCQANIELIKDYFTENQLAWTLDNLEVAFQDLEPRLAPVERPVASTPPANPVKVTPSAATTAPVTAPAASPAVQPVAPAPAQASQAANPPAAAPRPGVNGGLVPGENSGSRPVASGQPKGLTAEEIRSWDGPTMRAKMRDPKIRPQIDAYFLARSQTRR
jgi:hypothetical protein